MRSLALLPMLLAPAWGAIWPDQIPPFYRISAAAVTPEADSAVWEEYGFVEAERAVYEAGGKRYSTTAWRFRDSTGAMAAYQWLRPSDAAPADIVSLGVAAKGGLLMAYGNYVLAWEGRMPRFDPCRQHGSTPTCCQVCRGGPGETSRRSGAGDRSSGGV